jgi:photosynthetic reaction center cytochrome c subunit
MKRVATIGSVFLLIVLISGCEAPPPDTEQIGFRGLGMVKVSNPSAAASLRAKNTIPDALPPGSAEGPRASELYSNVPVLGHLSISEFTRVMVAITSWVAPEQGCAYCHAADLAEDAPYTKVVAREMLKMTLEINSSAEWKSHVADTGVTCYTCHRGKPVPERTWVFDTGAPEPRGLSARRAGQNLAGQSAAGYTSLPYDPFTPLLGQPGGLVRVAATTALPAGPGSTIQDTERTYALMMHLSDALGVNCTACHNSQSFGDWQTSTPVRVTAWHALRNVASLNAEHISPLEGVLPAERKGPHGDAQKVNCATCHQGVDKPLLGQSMLKDYPELRGGPAAP